MEALKNEKHILHMPCKNHLHHKKLLLVLPSKSRLSSVTLVISIITDLGGFSYLFLHRTHVITGFNFALLLLGLAAIITPFASLHNASTMAICAKSMTPLLKKDASQNSIADDISKKA